jgi:integrase
MGRNPNGRLRIFGPYEHGDLWRLHYVRGSGKARRTTYESFASRAEADVAKEASDSIAQGITVSVAFKAFLDAKRAKGVAPSTLTAYEDMLNAIIGHAMAKPVRYLVARGEELYTRCQTWPPGHRWAGEERAVDTHQNALRRARDFARFCIKRKWLRVNPFADVEPVGKRVVGADKVRLTTDESRRLDEWCRDHADNKYAVLTLAYLLLGMRASELCLRCVRDLDDGGDVLRIGKTKTASGQRGLRVPEDLRVMLLALCEGRPADAPIFVNDSGRRLSRSHACRRVQQICEAAKVTKVGPQGLRRTNSSLAAEVSETPLAIARHLGHATGAAPAVTTRAYVDRGSVATARVERVLRVIQGGRFGAGVETEMETGSEIERASDDPPTRKRETSVQ